MSRLPRKPLHRLGKRQKLLRIEAGTAHQKAVDAAVLDEIVEAIRGALERFWPGGLAKRTPVLYGGSVTPDNVDDLIEHGRIDGFLVGGASLDSKKFLALAEAMKRLPREG